MEFLSEGIRLISMRLSLIFLIFLSRFSPVEVSFPVSLNTIQPALVNLHIQITKKILQLCSGILLQILIMTLEAGWTVDSKQ